MMLKLLLTSYLLVDIVVTGMLCRRRWWAPWVRSSEGRTGASGRDDRGGVRGVEISAGGGGG